MTIQNNIPQGYKTTPLGIIPKEWEVKVLGDLCNSIKAGKNKEKENEGKYPVYGSTGLIGYTDIFAYDGSMILIARVGANAGFTYCINEKCDVSDNTLILNVKSCYNFNFAYNQLLYYNLNKLVFGSGQPLVTAGQLKALKIVLPPLYEQKKIAEVLGVWDKVIEKQSQLIEQLTLHKRGLMQQLLTAKRRLPGFSDPWKEVRLGNIGSPYNGLSGKNKENFESGDAHFIPYINIFLNERININNLESVEIGIEEHQNKVKYGDIFFTVSSETPNEVGMASVLLEPLDNTYLNSFCFGYRLNDFLTLSPFFATYLFRAEYFRHCMYILAQGSTRFNISKSDVMNLKINIPSIAEQTAIAEVLTAADREIELEQQKLELLRQQKRGLMQQLLTGKKRVKI